MVVRPPLVLQPLWLVPRLLLRLRDFHGLGDAAQAPARIPDYHGAFRFASGALFLLPHLQLGEHGVDQGTAQRAQGSDRQD